jgi:uncharacterized membrane protein
MKMFVVYKSFVKGVRKQEFLERAATFLKAKTTKLTKKRAIDCIKEKYEQKVKVRHFRIRWADKRIVDAFLDQLATLRRHALILKYKRLKLLRKYYSRLRVNVL